MKIFRQMTKFIKNAKQLLIITILLPLAVSPARAETAETDAELVARVVYAEARGETRDGMLMVAQCILDRLANDMFGDTIIDVVYAPGQFARPGKLDDAILEIAEAALSGERYDETSEILFFRKTRSDADWHAPYLGRIGGHAYYGYAKN